MKMEQGNSAERSEEASDRLSGEQEDELVKCSTICNRCSSESETFSESDTCTCRMQQQSTWRDGRDTAGGDEEAEEPVGVMEKKWETIFKEIEHRSPRLARKLSQLQRETREHSPSPEPMVQGEA